MGRNPHFSRTSTEFAFLVGALHGESGESCDTVWPHLQDSPRIENNLSYYLKLFFLGGLRGPLIMSSKPQCVFWVILFVFMSKSSLQSSEVQNTQKKNRDFPPSYNDTHSWFMPDMFRQPPLFFNKPPLMSKSFKRFLSAGSTDLTWKRWASLFFSPQNDEILPAFFFGPSQQENASDSEESSEEEVRVGQVAKWWGRPVLWSCFVLETNSWCTGKQDSSSDHLSQFCIKTVVMGKQTQLGEWHLMFFRKALK